MRHGDILDLGAEAGNFDYVLAHGIYSWVPEDVRDHLLQFCGRQLTPSGIAYVSYNLYPGNHFRDLARGMMRFHVGQFSSPEEQTAQARSLLRFVAGSMEEPDLYRQVLQREIERTDRYLDTSLFHDDLSPVNHPVYFHQFMEHAGRHGLQYFGEAEGSDIVLSRYRPEVSETLRGLAGNAVAYGQYCDFLTNRPFRQTLLCRQGTKLRPHLARERIADLFVSAPVEAHAVPGDSQNLTRAFTGNHQTEIESPSPLLEKAFLHLGARWPETVSFQELLAAASVAETAQQHAEDSADLAEAVLAAYQTDFLHLHSMPYPCRRDLSLRPRASRLARELARDESVVPTLRHAILRIQDRLGRHLVELLDGTRDRETLVEELATAVESGTYSTPPAAAETLPDGIAIRARLASELEAKLQELARAALLEA